MKTPNWASTPSNSGTTAWSSLLLPTWPVLALWCCITLGCTEDSGECETSYEVDGCLLEPNTRCEDFQAAVVAECIDVSYGRLHEASFITYKGKATQFSAIEKFYATSSDLTNVQFTKGQFGRIVAPNANFTDVSFSRADLGEDANFRGAVFNGVNLEAAAGRNIDFRDAHFEDTRLVYSLLRGDFRGAVFINADLTDSEVPGLPGQQEDITYINTICPNGKNSDDVGATCVGQFVRHGA